MTRSPITTLAAALLATTLGTAALTMPAAAGGSVTYHATAQNQKEERAIRTFLTAVALDNAARAQGVSISQLGSKNIAGITQQGRNNLGVVRQQGSGHDATINQNGDNNAYGVFQTGKNTSAHVEQNGNGGTGLTLQHGW